MVSLTRSSWQIETITGVAWEVEKELVFRRLPQDDPNKTVEESRMDAWKDLVEEVQRSQPAGSVESPHYAPPNLVPHRGLLLPTFPYPTLKPFLQVTFLRHTAKSQGFSTLNPKAHIPGSVCQLWRESLKQILSQSLYPPLLCISVLLTACARL